MGKCLSCCEEVDEPIRSNGQPVCATPSKSSVVQSGGATAAQGQMSTASLIKNTATHSPQAAGDSLQTTNGDKKMFTPYSKLPPIKKSNSADSKRISFTSKDISDTRIHSLYEKYKDPEDDSILADGIERLCNDLEVRPEEFRVLVLAWKFDAEMMCRFTRDEFVIGCKKLHVDSIKGIQNRFGDMVSEVGNKQSFKDLYRWTYKFGLDVDQGQRTLPTDMAVSLWQLVFTQHTPAILPRWLHFLSQHPHIRGISKDTWDMFLNFTEVVGNDLSCYDESEAWPSLFDDFVEYENDRENQNVRSEKSEEDPNLNAQWSFV